MNPKFFVAVIALCGSCIGLSCLLQKENVSNVSIGQQTLNQVSSSKATIIPENKSKVTRKLTIANRTNVGNGNCEVQEMSDDSVDFLLNQERKGKLYIELLCERDNSDTESGSWPHMWTGLFPEELFTEGFNLEIDKKFNLKTKTSNEEGKEKTTFQSGVLKSPLVGTWGEKLQNRKKETVTAITVAEQDLKIYILSN